LRVGLFRPITLWPFPSRPLVDIASHCRFVQVVEMSTGQMVEDVKLSLNGRVPVEFYSRTGGNVPSVDEVHAQLVSKVSELVVSR